jgi:CBS-domain-containing membrane protein/PII-like signaling protein
MTARLSKDAQLLTIFIGESDKWRGRPLHAAILETLKAEGIAGATVVRGVAGFGAHSHIHTASILRLSEDLPLIIQVVDKPNRIAHAIDLVSPMVSEGLVTVEDIQVVKYTHRYLNPLPADKYVEEVMTGEVVTLSPDMSVAEAWQKMLDTLLKALPVVDQSGAVVGMLTDEDLLERAGLQQRLSVAEKLDESTLKAEIARLGASPLTVMDVMSKPAITVRAKDFLGLAATRMAKESVKRLPVLDENGKLAGVLSRVDILRLVAEKEAKKLTAPLGAAISIRDVMSPSIPVVKDADNLVTIVDTMLDSGSHRVIVVDGKGHPVGLISDSDVVARIQPEEQHGVLTALRGGGKTPSSKVKAAELMSPGVLTARPETPLVQAVKMMMNPKRKWLVVVDEHNQPLGLVDRHILLRAMTAGSIFTSS